MASVVKEPPISGQSASTKHNMPRIGTSVDSVVAIAARPNKPDAEVRRGRANRWEIWPGPTEQPTA